jgi:hypothetical protein
MTLESGMAGVSESPPASLRSMPMSNMYSAFRDIELPYRR